MNSVSIDEIREIVDIPHHKIWNSYLYGSRVYGTNRENSDYDVMLVASSLDARKEIKGEKYNIHIITPDLFADDLSNYKMVPLECMFAPDYAKIQEKREFPFTIDEKKLIKNILIQSNTSWIRAKFKLNENDILRGLKSVFHSLRILYFGRQLIKSGKIVDFSCANDLWNEIENCNEVEWKYFSKKYISKKKKLEWKLINGY